MSTTQQVYSLEKTRASLVGAAVLAGLFTLSMAAWEGPGFLLWILGMMGSPIGAYRGSLAANLSKAVSILITLLAFFPPAGLIIHVFFLVKLQTHPRSPKWPWIGCAVSFVVLLISLQRMGAIEDEAQPVWREREARNSSTKSQEQINAETARAIDRYGYDGALAQLAQRVQEGRYLDEQMAAFDARHRRATICRNVSLTSTTILGLMWLLMPWLGWFKSPAAPRKPTGHAPEPQQTKHESPPVAPPAPAVNPSADSGFADYAPTPSSTASFRQQVAEADTNRRKVLLSLIQQYPEDITPLVETLISSASPETLTRVEGMLAKGSSE